MTHVVLPRGSRQTSGVWLGYVYAWLSLLYKALAAKQIQVHGGDRIENDEHQAVLG
jgi:hypothetical protein